MKYRVEFNPEARIDLLNLYDYIAERSGERRALAYIERIEKTCMSLGTFRFAKNCGMGFAPGCELWALNGA